MNVRKKIYIPDILAILNSCKNVGKYDKVFYGRHRMIYNSHVAKQGRANDCIECGKCEMRCPQKLNIRSYMKDAIRLFEGDT